jgi:PAS domain S-box-containing protein
MGLNEQFNAMSKDSLSMLLEQPGKHALFLLSSTGKVISCNKNAEVVTGYTMQEMHGLDLLFFFDTNAVKSNEHLRAIECAECSGIYESEQQFKRKDGTIIQTLVCLTTLPDETGIIKNYHLLLTQLSKNISSALHLGNLLDRINDAIFTVNASFTIVSWNKASEKIYGYTAEEAVGRPTDAILQTKMTTEERLRMREIITAKGSWVGESIHKSKDGKQIPILLSINVIRNENGDIEEYMCISTDISTLEKNIDELHIMQEDVVRRTQEKLDKSLKEIADYKYALDASSLVNITDANNIINYVNENFCQVSKYSFNELIGKNESILNSDFHSQDFFNSIWATIRSGNIWSGQIINKAKDGSYFWVNTTIVPFMDESGKPYQYLEIGKDITERKRTEEAYKQSEEIKNIILKASLDAVIGVDSKGALISWNKEAEKIFGWREDEVLGKRFTDVIIPERHRERDIKIMQHYLETGKGDVFNKILEVNVLNKEGEEFTVEFTNVPLEQNGIKYFCTFMRDISQRKLWERELKDSEQKYKMLFENNPLPMWMFTIPGRKVIEVNNAATSHYGYSREEFLHLNVLDLRPEEDKPLFIEESKTFSGGMRTAGVWRHKKKNGEIIYVEIFRDDIIYKGQHVRLVLANDISEKFRTEERLKESYEELRILASHLQEIREEERAVIAREIHDELGQQITGLKMDVSWISKRLQSEEKAIHLKIKSILELLDETVKTIRKIATELRPSILDDLGLIDALQWYSLEFEKRYKISVSFQTRMDELDLAKNASIGLFRIYQESLTNVARHSGATFVKSKISINNSVIELTIEDNGKGFDATQINKKKTLGLLGMKERTIMLGGNYVINSEPGKGTAVIVSVPLSMHKA